MHFAVFFPDVFITVHIHTANTKGNARGGLKVLICTYFTSQDENESAGTEAAEAQEDTQTYPPEDLVNKLAHELPEGVQPACKEVRFSKLYGFRSEMHSQYQWDDEWCVPSLSPSLRNICQTQTSPMCLESLKMNSSVCHSGSSWTWRKAMVSFKRNIQLCISFLFKMLFCQIFLNYVFTFFWTTKFNSCLTSHKISLSIYRSSYVINANLFGQLISLTQ